MSPRSKSPFSTKLSYAYHEGRIPLEGTDNFRDLGGYRTEDGRLVRTNLIFRSGHLGKLTDSDLDQLMKRGIRKIVDFRGPLEKEQDRNRIPEGADYAEHPVDVAGADMQSEMKAMLMGRGSSKMETYLVDVNRQFPRKYAPVFAAWLQDLARTDDAFPQVFHCTAGKDRTGFAAAILLRILGVDDETVMRDYLLSGELMADSIKGILKHISIRYPIPGIARKIRPILGVAPSFLEAAFKTIEEDWGDFESFVSRGLGLGDQDVSALKERFLD